jgi:hypothetical protein
MLSNLAKLGQRFAIFGLRVPLFRFFRGDEIGYETCHFVAETCLLTSTKSKEKVPQFIECMGLICLLSGLTSGKIGIRTLGTVTRSPHFECGPIDHSGIFPSTVFAVQMYGFFEPVILLNEFFCK